MTIYIPVALYGRDEAHSDPIYDLRQALQLAAEHVIPCFPDHLHPTVLQRIVSTKMISQLKLESAQKSQYVL